MKAYKLLKVRKDGTIGPLFINATARLPIGEWLQAEHHHSKKGFAYRPGWHCTFTPHAPHIKLTDNRAWYEVEIHDYRTYDRPESQGGAWILANMMKIVRRLKQEVEA